MSVPTARISRRRAPATRAAGRHRDARRPRRRRRPRPVAIGSGGAVERRARRAPRGRAPGRTRRRRASSVAPVAVVDTAVACSPATTCAFVTTSAGRRDPAAALLDLVARRARRPSRSTRARARRPRGVIDVPGGGPGSGGDCERAERRRERRVGDRPAPRREARRAGRAPTARSRRRSRSRGPCAPASPARVANDGMTIQSSTSTPNTPTAAPAIRSQRGSGRAHRERRGARARPSARPTVWPSDADEHEEQHRDRRAVLRPRAAERGDDASGRSGRRSRARRTTPAHANARATKPSRQPPTPATAIERDDDEVERVHGAPGVITYRAPAGGRG